MKKTRDYIAPRTCTELKRSESMVETEDRFQPLGEYRDEGAYVLLAPPGSGKTEEFTRQAELCGGKYVTARDFVSLDNQIELHDQVLFIDGLDEVRAGSADGRTPFDGIRNKLLQLDRPRFRLSCREADWFGSNDHRHLESVAPEGKVRVLRLDPLPEECIKDVLRENCNVVNPDAFVEMAQQRGVAALLENPLSLKLLAKAVSNNEWPDSRMRTFEMACETLADETNEEHASVCDRASTGVLLDTAGQLCAVQLLAGAPGIRLRGRNSNENYIELGEIIGTSRPLQLKSLRTRLFEAPSSEYAIPLHRQVAEFLGARYLAGLVGKGLPVNRILSLMSGYDGMIVTEMRGLCAWLAVHSGSARDHIVSLDPLGAILYGDVAEFPKPAKKRLLEALKKIARKDPWILSTIEIDSRVGDLVSAEFRNDVLAILHDPSKKPANQSLTRFVVQALCHAQPLWGMAEALTRIIRDDGRWLSVRQTAVDAFLRQRGDQNLALTELKSLMQELYSSRWQDPHDELLGHLLEKAYPDALPGTEVLDYLRPKKTGKYTSYDTFWTWTLPERASWKDKAEMLDRLAAQYDALGSDERQSELHSDITTEVPIILLDALLKEESAVKAVEPESLFKWLGVAGRLGDEHHSWGILHERKERIQAWLSKRPELWKSLLKLGLEESVRACQDTEQADFQRLMSMEKSRRLFGAKRPLDFATWCLDEALSSEDADAAKWLIRRVADEIESERVSKALVDPRLAGKDTLQNALRKRIAENTQSTARESRREKMARKEERQEHSRWQKAVRDNRTALTKNRASMGLLYDLATAYFGGYHGMSEYVPYERLSILLGNDKELVEVVLSGFRETVSRDDLPTEEQVIKLSTESRSHYLSLPYLAGFNELNESVAETAFTPDESQKCLAAAIFYNQPFWPNPWGYGNSEKSPRWLNPLLKKQPDLIANILIKSISAGFRKTQDFSERLYELVNSSEYAEIVRIVSTPLLEKFPVRCTQRELLSLRFLLYAEQRRCPMDGFNKLIKEKLEHKSMNIAQRVYWLATGLIVNSQCYSSKLRDFVVGNERRLSHLGTYFGGYHEQWSIRPGQDDVIAMSALIHLLGAVHPPPFPDPELDLDDDDSRVSGVSYCISGFVNQLMENPSQKASDALAELLRDESLGVWRTRLEFSIENQQKIRREANFKHAKVSQILKLLQNRQPANTADLSALTMDHLIETAKRIRHGDTSDWRQYWNVDSHNRVETPKPEDACRDALLSDLRRQLESLDIYVQPEVRYADDKRADVRVSYCGFKVPIEIKKSCHRHLWTAIRTQLIDKYTRDPGADGHGIYLVFWFGNHEKCRPTPDAGPPPKSADELKHRLEASLTDAERRKISISVIDVQDRKN